MALFAGIDLHSNNGYYAIVDETGKRVFKKRVRNSLAEILKILEPFKDELQAIAVESTYNWYWLVDGLMAHGYPVRLANPTAMEQYDGIKHADDENDAFFLAELLRLDILPQGYIYPKLERPVRDLLRRRLLLVKHRTAHVLSFQSLLTREVNGYMSANHIKQLKEGDVAGLLDEEHLVLAGETNIDTIRFLTQRVRLVEATVTKRAKLKPEYELVLTVPGIGTILGLTIMLETGPISRFAKVGNYTSYCRCAKAKRTSNHKAKGSNNRKNGNRYLSWAYVEAAHFARRYMPQAKSFYQRKAAKTNTSVATKALASKLSKACYFIMRDQVPFDKDKIFG